jgi:ABC-2 type transport system ATP-binding protein
MNVPAIELQAVRKSYRFFALDNVSLRLEQGQIMGFVGPNGAGKTTTIRLIMGMLGQDAGEIRVLGHAIPRDQAAAKWHVGFVSDDMALFGSATVAWHMSFVKSIYPGWDDDYARVLLKRFYLRPEQRIKGLSHGEKTKAMLLLVLARRPRLLVLDEPTSGLDPVARHELLAELMEVLKDDDRSILFSSHNTLDVEQISDQITFIDRGRIVESNDKEVFLDRWRRLSLDVVEGTNLHAPPGVTEITRSGHTAVVTTNAYSPELEALYTQAGATIRDVRRLTLEEIFVATVMHNRKERGE